MSFMLRTERKTHDFWLVLLIDRLIFYILDENTMIQGLVESDQNLEEYSVRRSHIVGCVIVSYNHIFIYVYCKNDNYFLA